MIPFILCKVFSGVPQRCMDKANWLIFTDHVLAASVWFKQSKQSPNVVRTKEAWTFIDHSSLVDITGGSIHCSGVLETWEILQYFSMLCLNICTATQGARAAACHLGFPCPSSCHSKDIQGCVIMSWPSVQPPFSLQLSFQLGSTKGRAYLLLQSARLWFGSHSSKLIVCLTCHHYIDPL